MYTDDLHGHGHLIEVVYLNCIIEQCCVVEHCLLLFPQVHLSALVVGAHLLELILVAGMDTAS